MRTLKQLVRNNRGATIIEFALVAPVFFLMVLGTLEFALIMHLTSMVEQATHEGARLGMTNNTYADKQDPGSAPLDRDAFIRKFITDSVGRWVFTPEQLEINTKVFANVSSLGIDGAEVGTGSLGGGDQIVLYIVTYHWQVITPFLDTIFGDGDEGFPIVSTVAIKNECFTGGWSCS